MAKIAFDVSVWWKQTLQTCSLFQAVPSAFFFFFFFTIETRRHASTPIILFVVVPQQKGEQKCSVTKIDNAMRRFLYAHQRNSSIDKTCRVW